MILSFPRCWVPGLSTLPRVRHSILWESNKPNLPILGEFHLEDTARPGEPTIATSGDVVLLETGTVLKTSTPSVAKGKPEVGQVYDGSLLFTQVLLLLMPQRLPLYWTTFNVEMQQVEYHYYDEYAVAFV